MVKTCILCNSPFSISQKELAFCENLNLPIPTLCPKDNLRAVMATRNEWKLYRRKCDKTGEEILSAYPPDSDLTIYKNSIWWGDSWDATDCAKTFDSNKPFFEQFAELQLKVPREGTTIFNSENCDYNGHIRNSKNCYLNALVANCEDCLYSYWITESKDLIDSMYTNHSTLCYWCSDVNYCFGCINLTESNNCTDCYFSYQLRGCNNCIFCTNLADKTYYIYNKKHSKEEFEKLKSEILNGSQKSLQKAKETYKEMVKKAPKRFLRMLKCENSEGDHLYNSKNCHTCFDTHECEDCENSASNGDSKDAIRSYSVGWPRCELIYQCSVMRNATNCVFCKYVWQSSDMLYCDSCVSCKNCFGCIGLRHKENCILNKQYTKPEYEKLKQEIIAHMQKTNEWGQFFPPHIGPFAYNESAAQNFFPLTKETATALGYKWREEDKKDYIQQTIAQIPDNIKDIDQSITNETLSCEKCGKNYKIIPQELKFYKTLNLPLPHLCSTCRHTERFTARNTYVMYDSTCSNCKSPIKTTYNPENNEIVFCEKCYRDDVD